MTQPTTPAPQSADRLWGLDQARAVAIFAMILAHFAPGAFQRIPQLQPLHDPVLWFGRLATPAFMVIFGVTAGFVFLPRYVEGKPRDTGWRLIKRAAVVFLCAIAIVVPDWIRLARLNEQNPWEYAFISYSVLLFYTLGLGFLPLWLRWLSRDTLRRSLIGGIALWAIGTIGYYWWPQSELSWREFARMLLFSGSYAYFQMMGTTVLAIPVGLWLRKRLAAGDSAKALTQLYVLGMTCAMLGGSAGIAFGEFDPERIISGALRLPPRAWYFLFFGGLALALIPALEFITKPTRWLRKAGYVLALFGQTSLLLFTGHAFVLPALAVLDQVAPLKGPTRVAIPFLAFAVFCGLVAVVRHRQVCRKLDHKNHPPQ